MKTEYILGSLDERLYLIVHCSHPGAKTTCWFETTNDESVATRYAFYTTASMMLITLGLLHPAIQAINLMPLPVVQGVVSYQHTLEL